MGVASPPGPQRPQPARPPAGLSGRPAHSPGAEVLDLVTLVAAAEPGEPDADQAGLDPEDRGILVSCREPVTVAEVASATALPVSVVRARLADLIRRGQITLQSHPPAGEQARPRLLNEVLDGLRAI